ncbi:MAG: RNA 2',3'-cyclic phosphodiesterase [Candidatus Omnitrophica bacterium]|nr:RNA 2',3'-cyclic phosphodiesterase [Candidatus Omnitrophota bacterium]
MRAFIAVELSHEWQTLISQIQQKIKTQTPIRWVKPSQAHLTLKFLGHITDQQASLIEDRLKGIGSKTPCLMLETESIGAFPSIKTPQIIWLGLKENPALIKLAGEIETALQSLGFTAENRDFKSHITLGRLKNNDRALISSLSELKVEILCQKVEHISLFKSTLTPQGPVHEILKRISFAFNLK